MNYMFCIVKIMAEMKVSVSQEPWQSFLLYTEKVNLKPIEKFIFVLPIPIIRILNFYFHDRF